MVCDRLSNNVRAKGGVWFVCSMNNVINETVLYVKAISCGFYKYFTGPGTGARDIGTGMPVC